MMKIFALNSKTGVTLIEVMIALIIIALVILGGGMFFFYGRVIIVREAHRRAAVLVASQRLEELKAADYKDIASDPASGDAYYITYVTDSWFLFTSKEIETVSVDNLPDAEMVTEAQWKPDGIHNYLEVKVTVNWEDSRNNSVSATTLIAPP